MRGWWVLACLVGTLDTASADDAPGIPSPPPGPPPPSTVSPQDTGEKPWEAGVSQDRKDRANKLFEEGDAAYKAGRPADALAAYEAAIAIWEHPVIRLSMALMLVRQDRILEAADSIELALKYDAAPFTPNQYRAALDYKKLILSQVGEIEVTCGADSTAQMVLDDKPWFTCPGSHTQRVLIGEHSVYADQPGFHERGQRLIIHGGSHAIVNLNLLTDDQAFEEVRRFPVWLPWGVLGVGIGAVAGGFLLLKSGNDKISEYDREVAANCAVNGCTAQELEQFEDLHDSGLFRSRFGTGALVIGAASVIGGFVMLVVNRPERRLRVDLQSSGNGMSASARWTF